MIFKRFKKERVALESQRPLQLLQKSSTVSGILLILNFASALTDRLTVRGEVR